MKDSTFRIYWTSIIPQAAKILGRLWYKVHNNRRRIAVDNLMLAMKFPKEKAEKVALANFIHLARVFLEFPLLPHCNEHNLLRMLSLDGPDFFLETAKRHRGFFIMTGHIGNWELMAYASPVLFNVSLDVIIRPLDNPWLNNLVTSIRTKTGNRMIPKKLATKKIRQSIKNGRIVAMLMDQKSSHNEGIYVPFFNRKVLTHKGLALLAIKMNRPVLPVYNHRQKWGDYKIYVARPIYPPPKEYGDVKARVYKMTTDFNALFEAIVRKDPIQWYWIHRRFRHSIEFTN